MTQSLACFSSSDCYRRPCFVLVLLPGVPASSAFSRPSSLKFTAQHRGPLVSGSSYRHTECPHCFVRMTAGTLNVTMCSEQKIGGIWNVLILKTLCTLGYQKNIPQSFVCHSAESTDISGVVFGDHRSLLESMDPPCGGIEIVLVCPFCLFFFSSLNNRHKS